MGINPFSGSEGISYKLQDEQGELFPVGVPLGPDPVLPFEENN